MIAGVSVERIIWMGRGEVRPLEGADPELVNATSAWAVVFAYATSADSFDSAIKAALADEHLELVSLEAASRLNEMMDVGDHLACAFETAESGEPTVLTYSTDEAPDAEDEDAVTLRAAAESGEAVEYRHLGRDSFSQGFVIDANESWALINIIDFGVVAFDGYSAIRIDCLIDAEIMADDHFALRALDRRGERPIDPRVPLDDHRTILAAVSERYPLVSLVDATRTDSGVVIGRITRVDKNAVTLRGVNTRGAWTRKHRHLYKNIEEIRFGRSYEAALVSVLPAE